MNDYENGKQEDNHNTLLSRVRNTAYVFRMTTTAKETLCLKFPFRRTVYVWRHIVARSVNIYTDSYSTVLRA